MKTFVRLLRLAAPFRAQMALAVSLGFLTVGSSVGLLATSAYLISAAALHPSIADLQVAIVGVRFFGISRGVFRYLERLVSHEATFRLLGHLRVWFYRSLEPLAPAHLSRYRTGDLHARIVNDIETLETFFLRVLAPPAVAGLTALGMGLFAWSFHRTLGLAVVLLLCGSGAGLVALTYGLQKRTGPVLVRERSQLRSLLVDSVGGIADLTAFGATRRLFDRIRQAGCRVAAAQRRANRAEALQNALNVFLANGAAWLVLLLALELADRNAFAPLYLAALTLATLASFEAVFPLPQAAHSLSENLEAARRLFEIVDSPPAVVDPPVPLDPPQRADLSVQNLTFSYTNGAAPALDEVSFSLPEKGSLAVVGPSGAGKSTLVNLLLRFWDVPAGTVYLGGNDIRRYRQEDVRRCFGVVSARSHIFNLTVRENLLLAKPGATEAELVQACQQAEIHEFIATLPGGYDTLLGETGRPLSGGERQRLILARALLRDAPILLLDEPTANLDALTEQRILQTLRRLRGERSLLLITHRLVGLEDFDQILVLDHGRVVERGTHAELLQLQGVYWRMWRLQHQIFEAA